MPWVIITQGGKTVSNAAIGIVTIPGMLTFLAGGTILITSLIIKTKSGTTSAPIASLVSLIIFMLSCVLSIWVISIFEEPCFEDFFGPNDVCRNSGFGAGFYFSMLSIGIAFISGRLKNPKG